MQVHFLIENVTSRARIAHNYRNDEAIYQILSPNKTPYHLSLETRFGEIIRNRAVRMIEVKISLPGFPPVPLPEITGLETNIEINQKYLDQEYRTERFHLELFVGKPNDWTSVGEIACCNRGNGYHKIDLLAFLTTTQNFFPLQNDEGLAYKITSVGNGLLRPFKDNITIVVSCQDELACPSIANLQVASVDITPFTSTTVSSMNTIRGDITTLHNDTATTLTNHQQQISTFLDAAVANIGQQITNRITPSVLIDTRFICPFIEFGSVGGIFWAIGTNGGKQVFVNPVGVRVNINAPGNIFIGNSLNELANRSTATPIGVDLTSEQGRLIIDFGLDKPRQVKPDKLDICSLDVDTAYPTSIAVEGSSDGNNWTLLAQQSVSFSNPLEWVAVNINASAFYQYLAIRMPTPTLVTNDFGFRVSEIEFYGEIKGL